MTELNSLHNLQGGGVDPRLQGVDKPKTNLLERQTKRDLVPMHICAKSYIMSERNQGFSKGQTKPFQKNTVTLLDLGGNKDLIPETSYSVKFCY